jgi:hypothetical protein
MNRKPLALLGALVCAAALASTAHAADRKLDCRLNYSLTGWSLIYKHTSGTGTVTCKGAGSMKVLVSAKALGLTVGKWKIDHGTGNFSDVHKITDVLGNYVQASANVGLAKSGEAQVLTNGPVSLALAGSGAGVNLGVDIGQFKIEPASKPSK